MTREQAINYLISSGFTHEQVGEVVRALTYEPTTKNDLPRFLHTDEEDEEIAKSFIEDVEAVKDQLPCFCEQMDFPNTFDEFADYYGFKDTEEVYTNGNELIQVFRVKQWLEHISTTKNNLGVEEVTALAEWTEKLTKASEDAYNKGYADGMKAQQERKISVEKAIEILKADSIASYSGDEIISARDMAIKALKQEPKTGHWIEHFDESGKWYECDQCHTDWGGAVNFCPDCGADMREVEE